MDKELVIPAKFHWIWFDFNRKTKKAVLPQKYIFNQKSWLKYNPGFSSHVWNEEEAEQLINRYYPQYMSLFKKCPYPVQSVDVFRIIIMHHIGGFYLDTDMECINSVEPLRKQSLILVKSRYCRKIGGILSNCFLASIPGNNFWINVLDDMKKLIIIAKPLSLVSKYASVMSTTGPIQLTYTYRRKNLDCYVGNGKMFTVKKHECDAEAFCVHNGDNTWFVWRNEWRRIAITGTILFLIILGFIVLLIYISCKYKRYKGKTNNRK